MKKIFINTLGFIALFFAGEVRGQSDIFAGGEISVEYAGNYDEPCGDSIPTHFTFRFYRDGASSSSVPLPPAMPIVLIEKRDVNDRSTWRSFIVIVDNSIYTNPDVPNLCVRNTFTATEGIWYQTSEPIMLRANRDYSVSTASLGSVLFGISSSLAGRNFHSAENDNLIDGQTYFIETQFNTRCGVNTTGPRDSPPNQIATWSNGWNETAQYVNDDIVESFCSGESYELDLNDFITPTTSFFTYVDAITGETVLMQTVVDEVEFSIRRPLIRERESADNASGFSTFAPFPTAPDNPFNLSPEGILTFTPDLPLGLRGFTSAIVIEARETRSTLERRLRPDGTFEIVEVENAENTVSISQRQLRFVIGTEDNCNRRLPEFSSVAPFDDVTNEYIFDCATDTFDVILSEPMLLSTLDRRDIRVFRGTQFAPMDDNAWLPTQVIVEPANINRLGEFTEMRVVLSEPLGPGNYTMFFKFASNQSDGTILDDILLRNRCAFQVENNGTIYQFRITSDDGNFYEFNDNEQTLQFCFPSDEPIRLDILDNSLPQHQKLTRADSFVFRFRGASATTPPTLIDTFQLTRNEALADELDLGEVYTVPEDYEFLTNPLINRPDGVWEVGVGLDYGWTHNGTRFEARCYDNDFIQVEIMEHPPVNFRDYDLCVDEDWPIIRDLVDTIGLDPIYHPVNYEWKLFRGETREVIDANGNTRIDSLFTNVGGQSDMTGVNDTLDAAGFAFGIDTAFFVNAIVSFPGNPGCVDSSIITLIREDVEASIGSDTIICEEEELLLMNEVENNFLEPERIDYEWFVGDQLIVEADSESIVVNEQGRYRLVITKNTDESSCADTARIFVQTADDLTVPEVVCSNVTSASGEIVQSFSWPAVNGAEQYEVRGVDEQGRFYDNDGNIVPDGVWQISNGSSETSNTITGAELRLEVRAVNLEIGEDAPCRFGPIGIADACEVVVRDVNVFTPDGDGINDFLRFDLLEVYPGSSLQVFNRWGRLIFESEDYQNDWDGENYEEGVYYYILNIDDPNDVQGIFKGTVTLLR